MSAHSGRDCRRAIAIAACNLTIRRYTLGPNPTATANRRRNCRSDNPTSPACHRTDSFGFVRIARTTRRTRSSGFPQPLTASRKSS